MQSWFINPVLAEIGPVKIHWYGVMYALAFIIGYLYLHYSAYGRKLKFTSQQKDTLVVVLIMGVLLGGRIGYILFYNLVYYLQNPLKIFAVWEGGMSFHGGLLGVALAIWWFSKKYRARVLEISDAVASIVPIGLLLGRLGNFINGELYGRIATKYCLYFPTDPSKCRYPSQLLESLLEGLVLFIMLYFIGKHKKKTGVITGFFFVLYGIFRSFAELFREPDQQIGYIFGSLTEGQILSIFMIIAGAIILRKCYKAK